MYSARFLAKHGAGVAGSVKPFFVAPVVEVFGGGSMPRESHGSDRISRLAQNVCQRAHFPWRCGESMNQEYARLPRNGGAEGEGLVLRMGYVKKMGFFFVSEHGCPAMTNEPFFMLRSVT